METNVVYSTKMYSIDFSDLVDLKNKVGQIEIAHKLSTQELSQYLTKHNVKHNLLDGGIGVAIDMQTVPKEIDGLFLLNIGIHHIKKCYDKLKIKEFTVYK
jgi:hypothetical protein